jgi:transcriptional regulator of acetoin/glycerol metabolism
MILRRVLRHGDERTNLSREDTILNVSQTVVFETADINRTSRTVIRCGIYNDYLNMGHARKLSPKQVEHLRTLAADKDNKVAEICNTMGISRKTFYRYVKSDRSFL